MNLEKERADLAGQWLLEQIATNGFAGVRLILERETEALKSRCTELAVKINENMFKLEVLGLLEERSEPDSVGGKIKSGLRLIKTEEVNNG